LFYNPRIIFLDEPFNDIDHRKNVITVLKKYCQINHIQIILISHSIYEIQQLTEAGIFLTKDQKNPKIYTSDELGEILIKQLKN
jgi:energy-coupling factor transporter ATP-binding protein EcfA2